MSNAAITWSYRQHTGSASTKAVLVALADLARDESDLKAFPCLKEICERTELNRKTVINALDALVKGGFVTDSGERKGKTGQIRVFQFTLDKSPKNGTIKESHFFPTTVPETDGKSPTFSSKSPKNGTRIPYIPILTQREPMTPESSLSPKLTGLHEHYCELTGFRIRQSVGELNRSHSWYLFNQYGFTDDDLVAVVRYLQRKIKDGSRNAGALKFDNLIVQLDRFEEDLGLARAEERNRKPAPTPRERVLEQARPTVVPMTPKDAQITAKPVGELIANLKRAAGMNT